MALAPLGGHHPSLISDLLHNMNDIINTRPAVRATLDANTDRIILPVDARRAGTVSLSGTWGDTEEYGPGCVVVELKTVAGTLWASHRITGDTSFRLPPRTERVEALVTSRAPGMSLELTVTQSAELAAPRTRSRQPIGRHPQIAGRWYTPAEAKVRERRMEAYRASTSHAQENINGDRRRTG